ncbi:hypothetical protein MACH23_33000 [Sulfitobacter pontiacus]|nr:hypothetical protein MACH23_33000 [Sulfitobacter pontiacus]
MPRILAASDLIAMMPRHSLAAHERDDIVTFDPPIPVDGFPLHLAWHRRNGRDTAILHVAAVLERIFGKMAETPSDIHAADNQLYE